MPEELLGEEALPVDGQSLGIRSPSTGVTPHGTRYPTKAIRARVRFGHNIVAPSAATLRRARHGSACRRGKESRLKLGAGMKERESMTGGEEEDAGGMDKHERNGCSPNQFNYACGLRRTILKIDQTAHDY
jgi:hypothetical protein